MILHDVARQRRLWVLGVVATAAVAAAFFVPPIPQPLDYHGFADSRNLFGVPNFWNVISNLPFLLVGVLGLAVVIRNRLPGGLQSQRLAYGVFFAGIAAVCFGSSYYHWMPSNATLVWDRLPMSIAFMAFVAIVIAEHIDEPIGTRLLWPLVLIGVFSVLYWDYTERLGRGDLRPYGLVQFLSLVIVALTWMLFPSRLSGLGYLWAMLGGYTIAKLLEAFDKSLYHAFGQQMSGHALKHVAAAVGMYCFVLALKYRLERVKR